MLKNAGYRIVKEKEAKGLITVSDKERKFLQRLDRSYHKKSNPIYGIFADEKPNFKNYLIQYIEGSIDFLKFSVEAMKHYKSILEVTVPATGGYMILCEYFNKIANKNLLLVFIIKRFGLCLSKTIHKDRLRQTKGGNTIKI